MEIPMSIVPASCLSSSDLAELGNNVLPAVHREHRPLAAVNRSLATHQEQVGRLYRRSPGAGSRCGEQKARNSPGGRGGNEAGKRNRREGGEEAEIAASPVAESEIVRPGGQEKEIEEKVGPAAPPVRSSRSAYG